MELMRYADTSEASSAAQRRNVAVRLILQQSPDEYESPDIDPKRLASWHEITFPNQCTGAQNGAAADMSTTCQADLGCLHLHSGIS